MVPGRGAVRDLPRRPVDRELTRRLVRLATAIGAVAVNVHCVDGSYDPAVLSEARRAEALHRRSPTCAGTSGCARMRD